MVPWSKFLDRSPENGSPSVRASLLELGMLFFGFLQSRRDDDAQHEQPPSALKNPSRHCDSLQHATQILHMMKDSQGLASG